jgi:hypothetical protein
VSILRNFFTLYIIALLLLPCSDTSVCSDERASMLHQDGTAEKDICTPFCICQCCRTAVEEINWFTWVSPTVKPIGSWNVFVVQLTKASPHNIWQPPRLA